MNAIEETLGLPRIRGALFETEKVVNELKKERKAELAKNAIVKYIKLTEQEDLKAGNLIIKKKSKELQTLSEELSTLDEKLRENNENIKLLEQIKRANYPKARKRTEKCKRRL